MFGRFEDFDSNQPTYISLTGIRDASKQSEHCAAVQGLKRMAYSTNSGLQAFSGISTFLCPTPEGIRDADQF